MDSIQDFQAAIERSAVAWGEAIKIGNHREANKLNNKVTRIVKAFKENKVIGKSVLIPLLGNPNPSVRLLAAIHALDLEIQTQDAESVLNDIANDPSIRLVRLMAQINLEKWNQKKTQTPRE